MNILTEFECDLDGLKSFAKKLANKTAIGDVYLLSGELGVGKTTFTRFFINYLYDKYKVDRPIKIQSPSYPILINYKVSNFEIYHYDLYRLENVDELIELDFFENICRNIYIVEWPEILIKKFNLNNYSLINFKFINLDKRKVKHQKFNLNVS